VNNRTIAALVLGFLIVSVLLTLFGIINLDPEDVLGYTIIILGLSLVYPSFKGKQRLLLFVGSSIFLTGVAVLVFSSFELHANTKFITPLLLLIMGISVLMVFILDSSRKIFLIISIISITSGLTLIYFQKPSKLLNVFQSALPVMSAIWPVFLILILIIILSRRDS
jgi:hypothetical protein